MQVNMNKVQYSLGKIAFEAYGSAVLGKTHDGKIIPQWDELSEEVKGAWESSARHVVDAYNRGIKK